MQEQQREHEALPDKKRRVDKNKRNDDIRNAALGESEPHKAIFEKEEGLRSEWRNLIELNKIIY